MESRLQFGSAFSRVVDLYAKHFAGLMLYAAIFWGGLALLWTVIFGVLVSSESLGLIGVVLGFGLSVVASILLTAAYIIGLDESEHAGEVAFPPFAEVWPRITPLLGPLFITGLLSALGIMLGLVLLIIPGLVLLTWWAVASPVVVLENKSGPAALGRSRELVKGHGWTVFGLILVVNIVTSIVAEILGAILRSVLSFSEIAQIFGGLAIPNILLGPISALLSVVIYWALRGDSAGGGVDQIDPSSAQAHPTQPATRSPHLADDDDPYA